MSDTLMNSGLNYRVILDGEMIAWDPLNQAIIPFGNLKTAALTEKENRSSEDGIRPLCSATLSFRLIESYRFRHRIYQSNLSDSPSLEGETNRPSSNHKPRQSSIRNT